MATEKSASLIANEVICNMQGTKGPRHNSKLGKIEPVLRRKRDRQSPESMLAQQALNELECADHLMESQLERRNKSRLCLKEIPEESPKKTCLLQSRKVLIDLT
jgi:hypothetical protein